MATAYRPHQNNYSYCIMNNTLLSNFCLWLVHLTVMMTMPTVSPLRYLFLSVVYGGSSDLTVLTPNDACIIWNLLLPPPPFLTIHCRHYCHNLTLETVVSLLSFSGESDNVSLPSGGGGMSRLPFHQYCTNQRRQRSRLDSFRTKHRTPPT